MTKPLDSSAPKFPLTAVFTDGDTWTLNDERDVGQNLEWHNSDEPDEDPTIRDADGQRVRVQVVAHRVLVCQIHR